MKMKKMFAALVLVALTAGPAAALTEQQEKMKQCNTDAGEKQLKGDARKEFMRQCLGGKPEANAAAKQLSPQQQKMKDCNMEAKKQQLKGDARKQFMSTCLSK
jgi:hypothetical protein